MNIRRIQTSSDLPAEHWIARQLPPGTSLRNYAVDHTTSEIVGALQLAVAVSGLSRAELAKVLGVTKSYVSQVLSGEANITVKTLGAFLWACGVQAYRLHTEPVGGSQLRDAQEPKATSITPPQTPLRES